MNLNKKERNLQSRSVEVNFENLWIYVAKGWQMGQTCVALAFCMYFDHPRLAEVVQLITINQVYLNCVVTLKGRYALQ